MEKEEKNLEIQGLYHDLQKNQTVSLSTLARLHPDV